jgi:dihydrofolate synthase/folylpolyglutamate synthase
VFARIAELRGQSVELGLFEVTRLLDRLDHPERDFPAIHVAGTNGKGSVCAMLEAQLRHAGLRVGLLTSPHLLDFSERVRVDGRAITETETEPILNAMSRGTLDGSFFEVATALAFEHFRRCDVDVAVLETGLGGRLDATNVCFPRVTAITSIDLDHVKTLGPDRATIAREKAGILKPGVPVVVGDLAPEAFDVIERIARRRGAPIVRAAEEIRLAVASWGWDGLQVEMEEPGMSSTSVCLPLPGRHQLDNLAIAAVTARRFLPATALAFDVFPGLADTRWPGRLQRVAGNPVRVYDVAHNAAGAESFAAALDELGVPEGSVLLVGLLNDKDLAGMARVLGRHFERVVTTTPPHPIRARAASETAEAFAALGCTTHAVDDVADAVREATRARSGAGWVFVTGSLFTVGAAMRAFGDRVEGSTENLVAPRG